MIVVKQEKSQKRDKILQRVLNLRARDEDSGASEAEMQAAFEMAAKLMDSYNIEEAELALAEAEGRIVLDVVTKPLDENVLKKNSKQKHKVLSTLSAVAAFTECQYAFSTYSGKITFTGHKPDVELANFLVAVIKKALDNEYAEYRRKNTKVGYGAKTSFQNAMASRISSRLYNMVVERNENRRKAKVEAKKLQIENSSTSSSTALIVSEIAEQKAKEVHAAYSKAHPNIRYVNTYSRSTNRTAHGAGAEAGSRVNLGRPVGDNNTKALK